MQAKQNSKRYTVWQVMKAARAAGKSRAEARLIGLIYARSLRAA